MTFSAASLVAGFPDPREDLVTVTLSLPREVVQALDIQNRMTRKPKKNIVMDALYAHLSARLIAEVRATLYPGRA
jgi:hypothetical protein